MAYSSLIVVLFALSAVQRACGECMVATGISNAVATSTVTTTTTTTTTTYIAYPFGTPSFYYDNGYPNFSTSYPFYNSYHHAIDTSLLTDADVNRHLAYYAYSNGLTINDMYQNYGFLHELMPSMAPDVDLNILQGLSEALAAERAYWTSNYGPSMRSQVDVNRLKYYLPSNYPLSYLNTLAYLDYLVPALSPTAESAIYNAIYKHVPSSYTNEASYLNYVMQTSARYSLFSHMSWSYSAYSNSYSVSY